MLQKKWNLFVEAKKMNNENSYWLLLDVDIRSEHTSNRFLKHRICKEFILNMISVFGSSSCTQYQVADELTKPLFKSAFTHFRDKLMVVINPTISLRRDVKYVCEPI